MKKIADETHGNFSICFSTMLYYTKQNIIKKAKKALESDNDTDYKALGRYIFKELSAQESRPEEYVEGPDK